MLENLRLANKSARCGSCARRLIFWCGGGWMDGPCEYKQRNLGPPHKTHPWDGVGAAIPAGDSDLNFRKRKLQLKLPMNRARNLISQNSVFWEHVTKFTYSRNRHTWIQFSRERTYLNSVFSENAIPEFSFLGKRSNGIQFSRGTK